MRFAMTSSVMRSISDILTLARGRCMSGGMHKKLLIVAALAVVSACGGGSDGGSGGIQPAVSATAWTPGVFAPAGNFAGQCTTLSENNWLRSWTNDVYLWYDEVVDRDPALSATPAYFDLLKTTATTPSGNPKDRFHFTFATAAWEALSESGVSAGYGA